MKLKGKRVLVTGGAGFLGSHLVDRLVKIGADVVVVDNLRDSAFSNLSNSIRKIEFHRQNILDQSTFENPSDIEVVFHLAANANVPYSVEDPEYDFKTNVLGTFNMLKMCLDSDIQKFVYASSAAVYGEPEYVPIDEKHVLKPISPYGASKLGGEHLGFAYSSTYGIPFTALRIFNIYGERQRRYVMYDFLKKLRENPSKLEVLGTGEQVRDFCYVKDAIDGFILAARKQAATNESLNLAGGNPKSIRELANLMVDILGLKGKTEIYYTGKSWKGDVVNLSADISKIRSLGFQPKFTLEQGIINLWNWFRAGEVTC